MLYRTDGFYWSSGITNRRHKIGTHFCEFLTIIYHIRNYRYCAFFPLIPVKTIIIKHKIIRLEADKNAVNSCSVRPKGNI